MSFLRYNYTPQKAIVLREMIFFSPTPTFLPRLLKNPSSRPQENPGRQRSDINFEWEKGHEKSDDVSASSPASLHSFFFFITFLSSSPTSQSGVQAGTKNHGATYEENQESRLTWLVTERCEASDRRMLMSHQYYLGEQGDCVYMLIYLALQNSRLV